MLKIFSDLKQLEFHKLMQVYEEANRENGKDLYPERSASEQLLFAEQDFYGFLELFFQTPEAICAVWEEDGTYLCALRLEPYRDGLLLQGVETIPAFRNRGFAKKLLLAVLEELRSHNPVRVYSHIHKRNVPSLKLHQGCGFSKILDHAVYADGSVLHNSCTMAIDL